MFAVGDMHAAMGDGEICFTGVEIAGEVDVRFDVLKRKQATWPVTELHDRWVPHACAVDYADALQLVSEEAAKLLVDEHGFTIEDAFIFLSVACDAGVAQACKPAEGFGRSRASRSPRSTPARAPFRRRASGTGYRALPHRVALLAERDGALARVLGAEDGAGDLALLGPELLLVPVALLDEDLLGRRQRERAVLRDRRRELERGVERPARLGEAVDERRARPRAPRRSCRR